MANVKYRDNLVGADGKPLTNALFQLPGRQISNAPKWTVTGSAAWTPPIGSGGIHGLIYADVRYMSKFDTGSDLDIEKTQDAFAIVNARVGIEGPDGRWGVESGRRTCSTRLTPGCVRCPDPGQRDHARRRSGLLSALDPALRLIPRRTADLRRDAAREARFRTPRPPPPYVPPPPPPPSARLSSSRRRRRLRRRRLRRRHPGTDRARRTGLSLGGLLLSDGSRAASSRRARSSSISSPLSFVPPGAVT